MGSRLPQRKMLSKSENETNISQISRSAKFAVPHQLPLSISNANPLMRSRANSPDLKTREHLHDRKLRRSRSVSDFLEPPNRLQPKIVKTSSSASISSVTATKKKPISTTTKKAMLVATKPTAKAASVKRIPAYDYKARYNDLMEKHTHLKEMYNAVEGKVDKIDLMEQQLDEAQETISERDRKVESLQEELNLLKGELSKSQSTVQSLNSTIVDLNAQLQDYSSENKKLTKENTEMRPKIKKLQQVLTENSDLQEKLGTSERMLFDMNLTRKFLHNQVLDLKGNIRVFCRLRPPLKNELNRAICDWNFLDEKTIEVVAYEEKSNKQQRSEFTFDQVFHPQSMQTDIFELVQPLIQSAFDGYNICIFAYGQTGSGKTYTMEGDQLNSGIIPRTVELLFNTAKEYKHMGWSFEIKASFLEIYNEVLYDLLSNESKEMDIRMVDRSNQQEVMVSNLTEFSVEDCASLYKLISVANLNRATASTFGNERSSRSHAVTQIKLNGFHNEKGEKCLGKINLIDLAGSESPKTSTRMDETKKINLSLSELTNVIMALVNQNNHVPYRNSKLTHLLMPSLGGNSKTLMFVNVSPFNDCHKESIKSLRFASTVNSCKMKVKKNKCVVMGNQTNK